MSLVAYFFGTQCIIDVLSLLSFNYSEYIYWWLYFLWPPICSNGQAIIFYLCGFYLLSFFSLPILSGRRLDVYHTSKHDVALVQI